MQPPRQFDFLSLLEHLVAHKVDFILIGGVCAVAHGAPITTFDLDVLYQNSESNLDRILTALAAISAYHREPGSRRLPPQRRTLETGGPALFSTDLGSLDFLGHLDGSTYEDELSETESLQLESGAVIRKLNLPKLIAVKEAAGRPKDLVVLPILRETLKERNRMQGGG